MLKYLKTFTHHQSSGKAALQINSWAKSLVLLGLAATVNFLYILPLLATPPDADTKIDNQATGTFTDGHDLTNTVQDDKSNIVQTSSYQGIISSVDFLDRR
jgi:hypothetical protein